MLEQVANKPEYAGYVQTLTDEKKASLKLKLKSHAEIGKIALCNSQGDNPAHKFNIAQFDLYEDRPISFNETLTMETFNALIGGLLENSMKWVDEALKVPREKHNYTEEHLTAILLVGGSTRVPLVRGKVQAKFPNTPVWGQEKGINPDEIVALGSGIVAAEEDPEGGIVADAELVDVTGHTLSVAVFDDGLGKQVLSPIIPKETPIPCKAQHQFQSQGKGQRSCLVEVYQGEGREINHQLVTKIGDFRIAIQPIEGPTPLRIGLDLDANGILVAHATDELTGKEARHTINYEDRAQIRPEELEQKRKELAAMMQQKHALAQDVLGGAAPATNPFAPQPAMSDTPPAGGQTTPVVQPPAPHTPPVMQTVPAPAATAAVAQPAPPAATAPNVDPTTLMNPIVRNAYQRALNSYALLSADKQRLLAELAPRVEAAALAGDQAKLFQEYLPQLNAILGGPGT
jgi:molecular chaperone DnaK (HSP70)